MKDRDWTLTFKQPPSAGNLLAMSGTGTVPVSLPGWTLTSDESGWLASKTADGSETSIVVRSTKRPRLAEFGLSEVAAGMDRALSR